MRNRPGVRWGCPPPPPPRSVLPPLSRLRAPVLAALALALGACQDPSGVGLTLIGDETSDPNTRLVATDSLFASVRSEPTGGFADGSGSPVQTRVLVGAFADAIIGDARATAYLDVRKTAEGSTFDDHAVDEVQIELIRAQVTGDTTATIPVEIREVTANWNPEGLPTDTTLATTALIGTGTINARDSVVTIPLPVSYVTANQDSLRGSFDSFEGFQLRVPEGTTPGAVMSFNATESSIVLISEEYDDDGEMTRDTVRYDLVEVYTALARGAAMNVTDRFLLRDGTPDVLGLRFNVDDLADLPIANASIRVPFDRSLLETGDGFVRPLISRLTLFAVLDDDTRVVILEVDLPEEGDEIRLRDADLTQLFQAIVLGRSPVRYFELAPPPTPLGLSTLPILVEEEDTPTPGTLRRPRLSLVTVGTPA